MTNSVSNIISNIVRSDWNELKPLQFKEYSTKIYFLKHISEILQEKSLSS